MLYVHFANLLFFSSQQNQGGQTGLAGEGKGPLQKTDGLWYSFHSTRYNHQGYCGLLQKQRAHLAREHVPLFVCLKKLLTKQLNKLRELDHRHVTLVKC